MPSIVHVVLELTVAIVLLKAFLQTDSTPSSQFSALLASLNALTIIIFVNSQSIALASSLISHSVGNSRPGRLFGAAPKFLSYPVRSSLSAASRLSLRSLLLFVPRVRSTIMAQTIPIQSLGPPNQRPEETPLGMLGIFY